MLQQKTKTETKSELDNNTDNSFLSGSLLGNSDAIVKVKEMIQKISGYDNLAVLLQGESGTGKNMAAKVIHFMAGGDEKPFVEVNCAAIPEKLLESELFGYIKGAYTGAVADKKGLVEKAEGGTLFLDEIAEMKPELQTKLLSFLESRHYRPIGGLQDKKVDVRVIAATNKNLNTLVNEGEFREDLFFRLNVVRIEMPPLRACKSDIECVANNFIELFNVKYDKEIKRISEPALAKLKEHCWVGNYRELRNVIERAVVFTDSDTINEYDIIIEQLEGASSTANYNGTLSVENLTLPEEGISFIELEKKILTEALKRAEGNQTKAAELLKLSRETLRYRLDKYKIPLTP